MKRYLFCITIILLLKLTGFAQSYGLTFNSHETVLEKRTSIDLSPEDSFCFSKNFELSFDVRFISGHQIYFGYVARMISNDKQNFDLIYDQRSSSFKIIIGENFSGISFIVDSSRLYTEWNRFRFKFDLQNHSLECFVNDKLSGKTKIPITPNCFNFLWGANDFQKFRTRDIPPMQIKDIRIVENNTLKYFWPLDEISGAITYDKISHRPAKVKNPVWIKPKYQLWDLTHSFVINGYAGVCYDSKHDQLYIMGSDSLAVYDLQKEQKINWIPSKHQNFLLGHQAIYDTIHDRLYDIYIDQKKVALYEFKNRQWDIDFPPDPVRLTEFWHANKFISPIDAGLYIVGGYGQLKYKNTVQRYSFVTKKWDTLNAGGSFFAPRYLAASGVSPDNKFAYFIGGYGSQTGDQMLDPQYFYELFRYDISKQCFEKMYNLTSLSAPFTFANSLVIGPGRDEYYGLIFPNDSFNSKLQLVKGSLSDSVLQMLASAIPYKFHDVQSFADLYYSPASNKLIAVTLFYSKEGVKEKNTEVNIYLLNFPPEVLEPATVSAKKQSNGYLIFFGGAIILCGTGIFLYRRTLRKKKNAADKFLVTGSNNESILQVAAHSAANVERKNYPAIYFFGQFQVFDKDGNEASRLFTPLLKELFLIIAIYTMRNGRGISSEGLNELLWSDKSEKDAKNNRSVNIAKLKIILEKTGNCIINKESGYWKFMNIGNGVYVDYEKYVLLLQNEIKQDKNYISAFAEIIKRGAFLPQTDYNWLDDIKSEISNSVLDICLGYIKSRDISKDPEFIIEIANYIFYFDHLNEDALTYKCKSLVLLKRFTLANNSYLKFIKDYKDIYGEDFAGSFHDIIS